MEVIIINGSPRTDGNTVRMCRAFARGVKSSDRDISSEIVHLYELDFKGCRSCFACKRKGADTYGRCVVKDAVSPVLERVKNADAVVFASPVYLMDITGEMKSFLERLIFPLATYELDYRTIAPKRMPVVNIYTMNVPREMAPVAAFDNVENFLGHVFSPPQRLCAYNTYQFRDYSEYRVEVFSEADKREYREKIFPEELQAAFDLGRKMADTIAEEVNGF